MPTQKKTERKRIFVSYRHVEPDQTVARALADTLKQQHDVFIDADIRPGSEWGEDIEEALQKTDFLIAFLSELAAKSPMTVTEVEIAHDRRMKTGEPIIIPVRLGFDGPLRYPLSAYINRFQYVSWRGPKDTGSLINQLTEVVTSEPTRRPRFAAGGRERLRAIHRVRHDWIDGYLRNSFYESARFDLVLAEKPDSVEWPLEIVVQRPCHKDRLLAPGTRVSSVFDEHIGQLLILGAPGSGKTTLLLELAQELLARAETDTSLPIPVVFNLSSWAARRRPLADWLVDEMNKLYDIPRQLARGWADKEQVLPLLDGLDEVAREHREACAEAINEFRKGHGLVPIVVCSRIEEYEALTARLRLPGAVVVQPLTPVQVKHYIERAGEPVKAVQAALEGDPTLWELLDTPLMLNIATIACQGSEFRIPNPEPLAPSMRQRRDQLFGEYVDAMFRRRGKEQDFTREQTVLWLAWLASSMAQYSQSVLYLGGLDRKWMATPARRWIAEPGLWIACALYVLFVGLRFMLIYAVLMGLDLGAGRGLIAGLILGLWEALLRSIAIEIPVWASPTRATVGYGGRLYAHRFDTQLAWYMPESLRRLARNGIIVGVVGGLALGLSSGGLVFGVSGFKVFGLVVGLLVGLVIGLFFALERSGSWVQHITLRLWLWRAGLAPWHYVRFLDYAAKRILLRKVGDGYIFAHRMLMEYFASQYQPQHS